MSALPRKVESSDLQTMNFHGDEIVTFKKDGEPYVAMRRIVENLDMSWGTQRSKISKQADKFNCVHINTVGEDGKQRDMLCIPVSKLSLWLATVNPANVKHDDKRAKIERYQEESAVALHNYWTQGVAVRGDLDGVVTSLDPQVIKILGGVMKGIVHKEVASLLPSLVEAELAGGHLSISKGLCASQVLDMAGYPKEERKGTRGIAQKVSNRLRRHHVEEGVRMNMGSLGDATRYLFDVSLTKQWLLDGGKDQIAHWVEEKKTGQQTLRLVQK